MTMTPMLAALVRLLVLALLLTMHAPAAPAPTTAPRSLPAIHTRQEFDALARTTDTPDTLPHLLFLIDRREGNRIYYINSKRYRFHRDFLNGAYLSLERGQEFFTKNYLRPDRRFIMGTLAWRAPLSRWTFEFWEGDLISPELIRLTAETINRTFFQKVAFKPNSLRQEQALQSLPGLEHVLESDLASRQDYQAINLARGVGRLRIIEKLDDRVEIGADEIVVLPEVPVSLPTVAGIITTRPSTPLSHINLLATAWGIPNVFIRNAETQLRPLADQWVAFETRSTTYSLRPARPEEVSAYQQRVARQRRVRTPRRDLSVRRIAPLRSQRAASVVAYGAKSANLGEVMHARIRGARVPDGFTLPFAYYEQFLDQSGLRGPIQRMLANPRLARDRLYRKEQLAALRARMQQGRIDPPLRAAVLRRAHGQFAGKGLFVRSSTNSEDLPTFSGAGLYTTVPNVRGDEALMAAIKTVWASVWNDAAYEARQRAGIEHTSVSMAALLQEGIDADSAGVLITTDPFDPDNRDAIYISAKRGLGIKVVEGQKIAEQLLFSPRSNAVRLLTRSAEDSLLQFDARGGVREVPITGPRAVLTDKVVRRLARAAARIKRLFGGRDQDIEWAYRQGQIYILQARPYLAGST